ncbi:MAG TPA: hypothetical protein VGB54_10775 [Allosphingosinicella sp.]|jgi:hypothetical protein
MDPWPFVIGAYAFAAIAAVALFAASYRAMRKAEGEADRLGRRE